MESSCPVCAETFATRDGMLIHFHKTCSKHEPDQIKMLASHMPQDFEGEGSNTPTQASLSALVHEENLHMLSGLRYKTKLNGSQMRDVKAEMQNTAQRTVQHVRDALVAANLAHDAALEDVLNVLADPLQGLHTDYLEAKQRKVFYPSVQPVKRYLGVTSQGERLLHAGIAGTAHKRDYVVDVPLEANLQSLWADCPETYDRMISFMDAPREEDVVSDERDSFEWQHDPRITDKRWLGFRLTTDGVDAAKPIGVFAGKQKVWITMYVYLSLDAASRYEEGMVQLMTIAFDKHVRKYGMDAVISGQVGEATDGTSFGASCRRLAQGVQLQTPHGPETFFGGEFGTSADDPAIRLLHGFKISVGSTIQICPYCMATKANFRKQDFSKTFLDPYITPFEPRSAELLMEQRAALQRTKAGPAFRSKAQQWGIGLNKAGTKMTPLALQRCPGVETSFNRASTDCMHDLFCDGVCQTSTALLVFSIVRIYKWATFKEVVDRFGVMDWATSRRSDAPPVFKYALPVLQLYPPHMWLTQGGCLIGMESPQQCRHQIA